MVAAARATAGLLPGVYGGGGAVIELGGGGGGAFFNAEDDEPFGGGGGAFLKVELVVLPGGGGGGAFLRLEDVEDTVADRERLFPGESPVSSRRVFIILPGAGSIDSPYPRNTCIYL